jgi:hypothetical protein
MSITATTLSVAISDTDKVLTVGSGSGFPAVGTIGNPPYPVRIDKEFMLAVSQPASGTVNVIQRGYYGTAAVAHDKLAKVEVSAAPSDFAEPSAGNVVSLPPYLPVQSTLGQDTTFTSTQVAAWGNQPQEFAITKASAAAITLVAPSKAQDGLEVLFTNLTDAIHVITATSLLASSGSGSPYTTATWANAKAGGGLKLKAENGLWNVLSATNVTLT